LKIEKEKSRETTKKSNREVLKALLKSYSNSESIEDKLKIILELTSKSFSCL
jgi:hypothetical protein